jgi:hypothetical protein
MKTIVGLLFVLLVMTNVQARSLHPETFTKTAELLTWDFDQDSYLNNYEVINAQVQVNEVTKIARLVFNVKNNCPPNAFCVAYIPVLTIELPLKTVKSDSCGAVVYTAEENKMPVDGTHQILKITDYSNSICEMVYVADMTIEYSNKFYNRRNAHVVLQQSFFTAEKFQR